MNWKIYSPRTACVLLNGYKEIIIIFLELFTVPSVFIRTTQKHHCLFNKTIN